MPSWRKWKECRGGIKIDRFGNPRIYFSGEKNRKLASTAEYITERVGSHATSFSLCFSLSLFIYTRSDSRPFTAHTSYLSTRVAWQIHCVLLHKPWLETQAEFPQMWHLPLSRCIFNLILSIVQILCVISYYYCFFKLFVTGVVYLKMKWLSFIIYK